MGEGIVLPRSRKPSDEKPYLWLSREALEMINAVAAESNQVQLARSVYLALVQCAPKDGIAEFQATRALVAHLAGVGVRSVDAAHKILNAAKVIRSQSAKSNGMDVATRYTLLSVRNGCAPVCNHVADMSGEGLEEREMRERMSRAATASPDKPRCIGSESPAPFDKDNPRPLPATLEEVFTVAESMRISREQAAAFWHYQNANYWTINDNRTGRRAPIFDWHAALAGFARTDAERTDSIPSAPIIDAVFWAKVKQHPDEMPPALVQQWIKKTHRAGWRIRNPQTKRMEPLADPFTACLAFCRSDLAIAQIDRGKFL
jgi:hypothetical protein